MANYVTEDDVNDWLNNCCANLIECIKDPCNSDKNIDDAEEAIKQRLYYPLNGVDIVEFCSKKGASDEIIKYAKSARKQKEAELMKIVQDFFQKESLN